jgi:hypothetical protein
MALNASAIFLLLVFVHLTNEQFPPKSFWTIFSDYFKQNFNQKLQAQIFQNIADKILRLNSTDMYELTALFK